MGGGRALRLVGTIALAVDVRCGELAVRQNYAKKKTKPKHRLGF